MWVSVLFCFVCFFFFPFHSKRANNNNCFFFPWFWMESLKQPPLGAGPVGAAPATPVPELLCHCLRAREQLCSLPCSDLQHDLTISKVWAGLSGIKSQ